MGKQPEKQVTISLDTAMIAGIACGAAACLLIVWDLTGGPRKVAEWIDARFDGFDVTYPAWLPGYGAVVVNEHVTIPDDLSDLEP